MYKNTILFKLSSVNHGGLPLISGKQFKLCSSSVEAALLNFAGQVRIKAPSWKSTFYDRKGTFGSSFVASQFSLPQVWGRPEALGFSISNPLFRTRKLHHGLFLSLCFKAGRCRWLFEVYPSPADCQPGELCWQR